MKKMLACVIALSIGLGSYAIAGAQLRPHDTKYTSVCDYSQSVTLFAHGGGLVFAENVPFYAAGFVESPAFQVPINDIQIGEIQDSSTTSHAVDYSNSSGQTVTGYMNALGGC